jgi:hypothetical protein
MALWLVTLFIATNAKENEKQRVSDNQAMLNALKAQERRKVSHE